MWTSYTAKRAMIGAAVALFALTAWVGASVATDNPEPSAGAKIDLPTGDPVSYVPTSRDRTGPTTEETATRQVRDGFGDPDPVTDLSATPGPDGPVVSIKLDRVADDFAATWYGELAAGAYAELRHTDERAYSQFMGSASVVGPNSKGVTVRIPLGEGAVRLGQQFNSPSDADLAQHVGDVAAKYGLKVADLQILHPLESAFAVTLVVPDGAKIDWTIGELATALEGKTPCVEGALIKLVSRDGRPLLSTSAAFRAGGGGLWFAPGQDDRFGAIHSHGPWG